MTYGVQRSQKRLTTFAQEISKQSMHAPAYWVTTLKPQFWERINLSIGFFTALLLLNQTLKTLNTPNTEWDFNTVSWIEDF